MSARARNDLSGAAAATARRAVETAAAVARAVAEAIGLVPQPVLAPVRIRRSGDVRRR